MKKLLSLLTIIAISTACMAQGSGTTTKPIKKTMAEQTAGDLLIRSANSQAFAMGFAFAGAGIMVLSLQQDADEREMAMYGAAGCFAVAISCAIASIVFKKEAGKKLNKFNLNAGISPTGVGLRLIF